MLLIREQQLEALSAVPREAFEQRLVAHFRRFYPREHRLAAPHGMRHLVSLGVKRGLEHGYATEREASLYVHLMIMLGADFDRDPQIPWAAQQIDDQKIVFPFKRIDRIHRSTIRYLEQTVGNDNQHIARAMIRIRSFQLSQSPSSADEGFDARILVLLTQLYPQKVNTQGAEPMRALVRHAIETAMSFEIVSGEGAMLFAGLMLMLGSGFATDPMYGWAQRVLSNNELKDEPARISALHTEAIAYLVASIAPA